MKNKPRLNFWAIWNMSFGFFGIQFGFGLQMANMSSIYQMLGAEESELPFLWLAAPMTGLIVQPIIGYMSDRTWGGLGRRRPYFLVGAVLASTALVLMPNSSTLWMAAGLLWLLDGSVNVSMEPFRAFVADMLPEEQRKLGFAVQSLLIGLGAVLASALPYLLTNYLGVAGTAPEGIIPPAVHYAFYFGAVVFLLAVLWTIFSTKEYPPDDMEAFRKMKAEGGGVGGFLREFWHGLRTMPATMRQLAWVQFFTWVGLFCMWIYFSSAITVHVFGGVKGDPGYADVVAKAGQWTGVCFSVYNGVSFAFSFLLIALTGENVNGLNPRKIVFLETRPAKGTPESPKDGVTDDGMFYDPWGTPYALKIHTEYDNWVEYYGQGSQENVRTTVIAVSFGKNKIQQNINLTTDKGSRVDDVVSFQ